MRNRSSVVKRKDGRELRRMTVYMPADLARTLRARCVEREVDLSDYVAESVRLRLGTTGVPPKPKPE